jgi:hypothetical protein
MVVKSVELLEQHNALPYHVSMRVDGLPQSADDVTHSSNALYSHSMALHAATGDSMHAMLACNEHPIQNKQQLFKLNVPADSLDDNALCFEGFTRQNLRTKGVWSSEKDARRMQVEKIHPAVQLLAHRDADLHAYLMEQNPGETVQMPREAFNKLADDVESVMRSRLHQRRPNELQLVMRRMFLNEPESLKDKHTQKSKQSWTCTNELLDASASNPALVESLLTTPATLTVKLRIAYVKMDANGSA